MGGKSLNDNRRWKRNANLQIPLVQIQQTKDSALSDDVVNEIFATDDGDWYISGGGVSFKRRSGNSHSWNVPNGGLINDVTLLNNSVLVAHSNGLTEVFSDQEADTIHHKKAQHGCALFNQSLPELPSTIFSIDYVNDGEKDWIAVKHPPEMKFDYDNGVGKNFNWRMAAFNNGQVLIGSPTTGWSTLSGQTSNQSMDAVKGGLLVEQNNLFSLMVVRFFFQTSPQSVTIGPFLMMVIQSVQLLMEP